MAKNTKKTHKISDNVLSAKAILNVEKGTLKFYYDNESHIGEGTIFTLQNTTHNNPSDWEYHNARINIYSVKFDSTFVNYSFTDLNYMFANCLELVSINMNNLKTSEITSINNMFEGCRNLKNVTNFGLLDLGSVVEANYTFSDTGLESLCLNSLSIQQCEANYFVANNPLLKYLDLWDATFELTSATDFFSYNDNLAVIIASENTSFDYTPSTSNETIFKNCNNLYGGNGTAYNPSLTSDISYARIDKPNQPGYFTKETEITTGTYHFLLNDTQEIGYDLDNDYFESVIFDVDNEEHNFNVLDSIYENCYQLKNTLIQPYNASEYITEKIIGNEDNIFKLLNTTSDYRFIKKYPFTTRINGNLYENYLLISIRTNKYLGVNERKSNIIFTDTQQYPISLLKSVYNNNSLPTISNITFNGETEFIEEVGTTLTLTPSYDVSEQVQGVGYQSRHRIRTKDKNGNWSQWSVYKSPTQLTSDNGWGNIWQSNNTTNTVSHTFTSNIVETEYEYSVRAIKVNGTKGIEVGETATQVIRFQNEITLTLTRIIFNLLATQVIFTSNVDVEFDTIQIDKAYIPSSGQTPEENILITPISWRNTKSGKLIIFPTQVADLPDLNEDVTFNYSFIINGKRYEETDIVQAEYSGLDLTLTSSISTKTPFTKRITYNKSPNNVYITYALHGQERTFELEKESESQTSFLIYPPLGAFIKVRAYLISGNKWGFDQKTIYLDNSLSIVFNNENTELAFNTFFDTPVEYGSKTESIQVDATNIVFPYVYPVEHEVNSWVVNAVINRGDTDKLWDLYTNRFCWVRMSKLDMLYCELKSIDYGYITDKSDYIKVTINMQECIEGNYGL